MNKVFLYDQRECAAVLSAAENRGRVGYAGRHKQTFDGNRPRRLMSVLTFHAPTDRWFIPKWLAVHKVDVATSAPSPIDWLTIPPSDEAAVS